MSLGYEPGFVPQEWDSKWVEEEFQRLAEIMSKVGMERAVLYPQAVEPTKLEEGMMINADGVNWNPGFGVGPYIYENGRWQPMSGSDFLIEVGKGKVPGHSLVLISGVNLAATTTLQDVWSPTGTRVPLQAAEAMDVVSTDTTNDISTGANARTVLISGLDANWLPVTETVTLLATPVTTTQTFIRINSMQVTGVGTYDAANLGTITATATTAGTVQDQIEPNWGLSSSSHYAVPAGFNAQVLRVSITIDAGKTGDIHGVATPAADVVVAPFSPILHIRHWEGVNAATEKFETKPQFPEKTDMGMTCVMTSGTGEVSVIYEVLLVDNTL